MKKRRIGIIIAVAAVALVGSTTAYAAGYGGYHRWNSGRVDSASAAACLREGTCWRDTDGDGVRDAWSSCWADEDGDGVCDLCGGLGFGYADNDGDGICDYYGGQHAGGHHGGRHCRR